MILDELKLLYPEARCELDYKTPFQLACAVMLSAQTTDVRVNIVTKELFLNYPDVERMKDAQISDLERIIKSIGLYHSKANNLFKMANQISQRHDGILPTNRRELEDLSGIGRKSANVILSECFHQPNIAVDTHVNRISKRLKLAKPDDNVLNVEKKLRRKIKRKDWISAHHLFIFFGRNKCYSKNPECETCPFSDFCREYKKK
jgi:endonuclease-3